jgi:hypothetical protein
MSSALSWEGNKPEQYQPAEQQTRITSSAPRPPLSPSLAHRLHRIASVRYGIRLPERDRTRQNITLTGSRSTEAVMGVVGGLENVEEREEKSKTGEDIATDMLKGSQRNRAGMEGGEDAKTPPQKTLSSFCHRGTRRSNQAADI